MMKHEVGILYLDHELWQWWVWNKKLYESFISWSQFIKEVYACFDKDTQYLGHITKLRQTRSITNFMVAFEKFSICANKLTYYFYKKCFISGLRDDTREQFRMKHPTTWLEAMQMELET
jgi:hypothetical protein